MNCFNCISAKLIRQIESAVWSSTWQVEDYKWDPWIEVNVEAPLLSMLSLPLLATLACVRAGGPWVFGGLTTLEWFKGINRQHCENSRSTSSKYLSLWTGISHIYLWNWNRTKCNASTPYTSSACFWVLVFGGSQPDKFENSTTHNDHTHITSTLLYILSLKMVFMFVPFLFLFVIT